MLSSVPKGEVLVYASSNILGESSHLMRKKNKNKSPLSPHWAYPKASKKYTKIPAINKLIFQYIILLFLQARNAKQEPLVPHTSELFHDSDIP